MSKPETSDSTHEFDQQEMSPEPEPVKEEEKVMQQDTACCEEFTTQHGKRDVERGLQCEAESTKLVTKEHDVLTKNHVTQSYKIMRE